MILLSSILSDCLEEITKGAHDDKECDRYGKRAQSTFGQVQPDCQFKGNKSKIKSLIKKIKVDSDGSVTEVAFDDKKKCSLL